jgi:hypothetical protein
MCVSVFSLLFDPTRPPVRLHSTLKQCFEASIMPLLRLSSAAAQVIPNPRPQSASPPGSLHHSSLAMYLNDVYSKPLTWSGPLQYDPATRTLKWQGTIVDIDSCSDTPKGPRSEAACFEFTSHVTGASMLLSASKEELACPRQMAALLCCGRSSGVFHGQYTLPRSMYANGEPAHLEDIDHHWTMDEPFFEYGEQHFPVSGTGTSPFGPFLSMGKLELPPLDEGVTENVTKEVLLPVLTMKRQHIPRSNQMKLHVNAGRVKRRSLSHGTHC